jgi:hypothetical protein
LYCISTQNLELKGARINGSVKLVQSQTVKQ